MKYLPLILSGGRPPRYIHYGGINAFNAQMAEQKRDMALSEVLRQLEETHRRLLDYLHSVPDEHFSRETPFRHRLRLDTYSHSSCTPGRYESGQWNKGRCRRREARI